MLFANSSIIPKAQPKNLKISVIMPVYNRAHLMAAAIRSVLAQQGADFELVVIDDGSTDGFSKSPELTSPAIRLLQLERVGISAARNHGIAACTGDIIVYLDSDNTMYPGYLHAVAAAYAASPKAECGHAAQLWDDRASHVHLRHDEFAWPHLLSQCINLDLNCFSHRKSLWRSMGGFDETLTKHSDYDLALRYTRAHTPRRINAIAARYYSGNEFPRISVTEASAPNFARILAKHRAASQTPLKVLFVCNDYPQHSESYIHTEIRFLLARGYEIEVFQLLPPGSPGQAQVPVHTENLAQVIRNFRPALVHCHWLPSADVVANLASQFAIPVTVRAHGFEYSPESLLHCAGLDAVKSIYLFPHFAAPLLATCPKVKPVTACFNSTLFYPRLQRDRRLVLRVAACLESKDIELFFRAAARCPEFRFVLVMAKIANRPHLPPYFRELNESLGNPVDLRFDMEDIASLMAQAAIYLHTFGFIQPFGMPVSIAESMACGAVPLVRDCPAARQYAGQNGIYYNNKDEVVHHINATLAWTETDWSNRAKAAADFAYTHYADDVVLQPILEDWHQLAVAHSAASKLADASVKQQAIAAD